MNFKFIKLQLYLLLLSLTFFLTCEDKITDSDKFGAVHVEIVFNNDNSQNNKQSTNNGIKSFTPKNELFRTVGKNIETDEVAEENIQGLHTEKDVNNSILNKSLSGDITSITITISGVDPVNVDVSSGETVSKTIDGVPVGQQTVKIDLKDSAGTIIYTQTQTVEVTVGETSSPSFSADEFTPENLSITVTSPNGGESWEIGTTHDITWNSSHSGLNVKIELYQGGSAYQTLSSSQTNDGSYSWSIPSTYNEGSDYKVRISYVSDENENDESDGNFTLAAPPSITVTSPNGGEEWELGSSQNITWTSTNVTGNIKIMLYASGNLYQTISSSESNDGNYSWSIPSTYNEGNNYQVRISSVSDPTVYDESDGNFTLFSTPVDLTGTWSVTWDWYCDGADGTTDIVFYSDGTASNTAGSEIEWTAETGTANLSTGACAAVNFSYNAKFTYTYYGTVYYLMVDGDEADGPQDSDGSGTKDGECEMTLGGGGGGTVPVSVEIYTDNYPAETSWDIYDASNNYVYGISSGSLTSTSTLYEWDLELDANTDYIFTIYDTFGDGICCAYGVGNYNLYVNNNLIASGGEFGFSESTQFNTGGRVTSITRSFYSEPHGYEKGTNIDIPLIMRNKGQIRNSTIRLESSHKSTRLHKSVPWKLKSKNGE